MISSQKTPVRQEGLLFPWQNENWRDLSNFLRQSTRTTPLLFLLREGTGILDISCRRWEIIFHDSHSWIFSHVLLWQYGNLFPLCPHLVKPSPASRGLFLFLLLALRPDRIDGRWLLRVTMGHDYPHTRVLPLPVITHVCLLSWWSTDCIYKA